MKCVNILCNIGEDCVFFVFFNGALALFFKTGLAMNCAKFGSA